jgi:hypothetical protein
MAKITTTKATKGKNIRFSDKAHKLITSFCKRNGYNLGSFCEIAAMDKIKVESTKNI